MELNYLDEKEVVAFCFNNLKETAFILYKDSLQGKKDQLNGLTLVEEDFQYKLTHNIKINKRKKQETNSISLCESLETAINVN